METRTRHTNYPSSDSYQESKHRADKDDSKEGGGSEVDKDTSGMDIVDKMINILNNNLKRKPKGKNEGKNRKAQKPVETSNPQTNIYGA